jgi:uroporphyrinogen decarboxylase
MTSRERILTAIARREPDRVPVDLGATPSSGISAIAYGRLKQQLGITGGHTRVYDVVQQLAQPEEMILDRFGVDAVDLGRTFNTEASAWYDFHLGDGQPAQYPAWFHPERQPDGSFIARLPDGTDIAHMPAGGTFFDQTCFPYLDGYPPDFRDLDQAMGRILWSALVHSPWDHARDPGFWDTLRQKAQALRQSSDRALMLVIGCNLFEWGTFLRRVDGFLYDLAAEPETVEA